MSNSNAPPEAPAPLDFKFSLMISIAELLIPFFKTEAIALPIAGRMALEAIDAYQPETRADFINVARIIAFSMAALALLGKAVSQDMTVAEQMRALGRANALNRSADQSERAMMQRRRYQRANPLPEPLAVAGEAQPPLAPLDDAEVEAAIEATWRVYRAALPQAGAEAAATLSTTAPSADVPLGSLAAVTTASPAAESAEPPAAVLPLRPAAHSKIAMPQSPPVVSQQPPAAISPVRLPFVTSPDTPAAAALRYGSPRPDAGPSRTAPYKGGLLQNAAMPRGIEQSAARLPDSGGSG